ncbi:MAG: O-antigen ligase family protein [Candidatus Micrarchaeaceae archaeon]
MFLFGSIGVYLTQGRSSIISYVVMMFGGWIIFLTTYKPISLQIPLLLYLIGMICLQYYVATYITKQALRFSSNQAGNTDNELLNEYYRKYTKNQRPILWRTALEYIQKKAYMIFRGYGLSNIPEFYLDTNSKELSQYYPDKLIDSSHNFILDLYISLGLIGAVISVL